MRSNDEQAVLARVRYNRLIDIFLGIACYSLQNHLRTTVPDMGQVETDEIYVGVDKSGSHYVVPVQAKSGNDELNRVQIEQDIALCADKLPSLICRPVGTQFIGEDLIALFEFESGDDIRVVSEKALSIGAARGHNRRGFGQISAAIIRRDMIAIGSLHEKTFLVEEMLCA